MRTARAFEMERCMGDGNEPQLEKKDFKRLREICVAGNTMVEGCNESAGCNLGEVFVAAEAIK